MKRIVHSWKPLTCCIASLLQLVSSGPVIAAESTANAAPVIEDPLFLPDGTTKKIDAKIPVGKTLLIPIAATDADGDPLSYTVTSSNPKVLVRARTGRPHLKIKVDYAGDPDDPANENDPVSAPFSGELDFQLYRDWTPVTASFIGGFAQSFFYSPNLSSTPTKHTIFHRVIKDFMCQGGDPNGQFPDPPAPGENQEIPAPLVRGPGFSFENEFDIPLLFSGRGQLAMANAGSNHTSKIFGLTEYIDYGGTNGSQFFITVSSPRNLDIKHTIFGQLVRGWDILEKMQNVPVTAQLDNPRNPLPADKREQSRPTVDIKITETSVEPNFSDAVLVLSATGKTGDTPATIRVQVSDGKGGVAERTFPVTAVEDEFNTPPFFTHLPKDQVLPGNRVSAIPVRGIDLEQDFFTYENRLLPRFFPRGQTNQGGNPMLVLPESSSNGALTLGFWMRSLLMSENSFEFEENENSQQGQRDRRGISIGVNDLAIRAEAIPVAASPGTAMENVLVASYSDGDPRRQPSALTVAINWGDGTPVSAGAISRDQSQPVAGSYTIRGSHTYARKGVYPVVTTITSAKGLKETVYSTAIVTDSSLRVVGQKHTVKGSTFSGMPLAFFTDTASPGATAADYEATVDWGDGMVTAGVIKQTGAGQLYVTGVHKYRDPETFSVAIRLRKKGAPEANDAYNWATLDMTGFQSVEPHLPPFPMAHVVGLINPVLKNANNPNTPQDDVYKPLRQTVGGQTTFSIALSILNNGNKKANPSKIRFYLSTDQKLNLQPETYTEGSGEDEVTRTNPKDIPLTIGKTKKELSIIALKPGQGGGITFDLAGGQDSRVFAPKGENGTGYYLLAAFVYDDPLAKLLPIDHQVAVEVAPSITVSPTTLEVTEYAGTYHTQKFTISFQRKPTHEVKIVMKLINSSAIADTTEAEFTDAPAESKGDFTVIYTPAMWDQGKKNVEVSITGKPDTAAETSDGTAFVQIDPPVSDDARFHNRVLPFVRVTNRDLKSFIQVDPVTLETREASGSGHTKTFTVKLLQKPTKDVKVPIVVGDATEGQVSGQTINTNETTLPVVNGVPTLTFKPNESYPVTRTITVTGIDDNEADGNQTYTISVGPTVSEDTRFVLDPPDVSVTNVDNPPAPPTNP